MFVEAADVPFEKPGQGVARGKDKVVGKNRGELFQPVFDDAMVGGGNSQGRPAQQRLIGSTPGLSSLWALAAVRLNGRKPRGILRSGLGWASLAQVARRPGPHGAVLLVGIEGRRKEM